MPVPTAWEVVTAGMLCYEFMQRALLVGLLGGVACSIVGVLVIGMRLSLIGVSISHAAFAGGVIALFTGCDPLFGALAFSLTAAAITGPLSDRGELNPDTALGIIFSVMVGLAFLFIGIMPEAAKIRAQGLIWGSILTVTNLDLQVMIMTFLLVIGVLALFYKEVQAILFNREIALAVGLPASWIFYGMLFMTGVTVSATLQPIGGLLVFSLIIIPAATAYQLTYNLRYLFLLAAVFGVTSCWLGLVLSYLFALPSGGTIITVSSMIFLLANVLSPKRKVKRVLSLPAMENDLIE